jgi:hypothetical protein
MARAKVGAFTAWLKAGGGPSHNHADLCSTTIAVDGTWVVGDPGTGTYNGALEMRNYFRSSIAHSVSRLDGHDQLEPHRVFRWVHTADGQIGSPPPLGNGVAMWGLHDAYRRGTPPRAIVRAVVVRPDGVLAVDWVEGEPNAPVALSLPLGPGVAHDEGVLVMPGGARLDLTACGPVTQATGSTSPYDGWWSDTYGTAVPSTRLEVSARADGPVWWSIGREGSSAPAAVAGAMRWEGLELALDWRASSVSLTVHEDGTDRSVSMGRRP